MILWMPIVLPASDPGENLLKVKAAAIIGLLHPKIIALAGPTTMLSNDKDKGSERDDKLAP